jgi:4-amino-4-deoxy-L-arabinose transferase-like glycosyltransferase
MTPDGEIENMSPRRAWCVIVLLAATVCFTGLLCPLQEPQESRYAEIARQMLTGRSFLIPVLHGQPYYDKPPLVPCLAAFATILVAHGWARRWLTPGAAFLGAVILCLAPRFVQLDRMVTMDSLLCLWVVTALATGQVALASGRLHGGWWVLSAMACGLGLLTKGPVTFVLVLVPLLALRWLEVSAARPGVWALAGYLAVSIGLAAPWFVAVALRDAGFLPYFFWFHHVQRFVEPFDHAEPAWFYLPEILGGMLPWSLLLPGLVLALWRGWVGQVGNLADLPALRVFGAAGLWCVVFFSLGGCKRAFYVLPAVPPLALALGGYLDSMLRAEQLRPRVCCAGTTAVLVLMLAGVFGFLPMYAARFSLRGELTRLAPVCDDGSMPIVCYPRRWDSVSFYLGRDDVQVFTKDEIETLLVELQRRPGTIVVARTGQAGSSPARDLQQRLPTALVWESLAPPGHLTIGRVTARKETLSRTSRESGNEEGERECAAVNFR